MDPIIKYERAKLELERLRSDQDRYKGAEQLLLEKLNDSFGLSSLKEAEAELVKLTKKIEELEFEIHEKLDNLEHIRQV